MISRRRKDFEGIQRDARKIDALPGRASEFELGDNWVGG